MTAKDPKVTRIHGLTLFKSADKKALENLSAATDEVTIPAGETVISQGRLSTESFIIISGLADVVIDDEVVAEVSEGQMVGELSFFDHGPASATVTAKSEMTLLVLPHNRLDQILDDNPGMVKLIAKELAKRLRTMDKQFRQ